MKSITFTGGLGAQIVSTSAYLYLKKLNTPVRANFDYFDIPKRILQYEAAGIKLTKTVDFFSWQLDEYGFEQNQFITEGQETEIIQDGSEKHRLSIAGFSDPEVCSSFKIPESSLVACRQIFNGEPFACLHIRRGDYVRVASYLLSENQFLDTLRSVSGLIDNVLLLSDSELSTVFLQGVSDLGLNTKFVIGGNPVTLHGLMRLSNILICSNSQFSYTAAFLRERNKLTILPSRHEAGDHSEFNVFLRSLSIFQIFNGIDCSNDNK